MKRDQKGFTIVELLIAVAILAIVVASVCGFILVGSRSYAAGNSDINVQQESQLALNQMSDVMIDTTRSVNYVGYDAGGNPETALKDAEFSFTPEDKSLVMYNGVVEETAPAVPGGTPTQTVNPGNGNKHYHFYWNKERETLYYTELGVQSTDVDTTAIHFPAFDAADPSFDPEAAGWFKLASHVTDFSVDLSQVEEKRVVQLALTFKDGKKEYVTSNNVTIRNKVGVNDAELAPLKRRVEIDIAVKPSIVMEPGETFTLPAPTVTGKNVTDKSVKWSISSVVNEDVTKIPDWDKATQFTDADNGILHVSSQAEGSFDVKVTTNAEDSNHNKASATLRVNIKRVKDITLWKSADSNPNNGAYEISPGCTFTVSAKVTGDFLGEVCDACGEDVSIDKHIFSDKCTVESPNEYVWRVWSPKMDGKENEEEFKNWHPENDVKLDMQDEYKATFHVEPNVPDGGTHGYVIQAMSLLARYRPYGSPTYAGRRYDWVWRSISFNVKKGKDNIGVDGNLRWGMKSDIWFEIDYPPGFNQGGNGNYLVCARIREEDGKGKEKIMIYRTIGTNTLVTPDLFGIEDISKPWYLSLQVIDPGQDPGAGIVPGTKDENGREIPLPSEVNQISSAVVRDVVQDYLANSPGGTYNGKYPHTGKYEGRLMPPEIFYEYDGRKNISGKLELNPVSTMVGPSETKFLVESVKNTSGEVFTDSEGKRQDGVSAFANKCLKLSVFKEKDGGGLESIYWYDKDAKKHQGSARAYNGTLQFDHFEESSYMPQIKLEMNNKQYFAEAEGRYQIIPSIAYTQMANKDTTYQVYYADYEPRHGQEQWYPLPESTVYYELNNGGNLKLWSYDNHQFTSGEIYFPAPSDLSSGWPQPTQFDYFFNSSELQADLQWHDAKWTHKFDKIVKGSGDKRIYYDASKIKGRYVKDADTYEIELFYKYEDATWNRKVEVSAGIFRYDKKSKRWEQGSKGTYDGQLEKNETPDCSTASVNFWMKGKQYNGRVYIPLPWEDAFTNTLGFERKKEQWQEKDNFSLKYLEEGQNGLQDMQVDRMVCSYNREKKGYTIIIFEKTGQGPNDWKNIAEYFCESDGDRWTRQ